MPSGDWLLPTTAAALPQVYLPKVETDSTFCSTKNTYNQQVGVENSLIEGLRSEEGTDKEMEANLERCTSSLSLLPLPFLGDCFSHCPITMTKYLR
jgi:hypothetical protein